MSRRHMLKVLTAAGGGWAMSAWLTACANPSTTQSTPASAPGATKVPAPAIAKTPKFGGDIVSALSTDIATLDTAMFNGIAEGNIFAHVYNRLTTVDEKGEILPSLAESWEEDADHLKWTLRLRQGVKFHDDTDFNAEAVKFNIDRYIDPNLKSLRKGEIPAVTGVDVVDPKTVRIKLSQPFSVLPYALASYPGTMVSPAAIKKYGADIARNAVGTGPFVFKEWVKNDRVVVVRNEKYWDTAHPPYLKSITFKGIPDATVVLNGVRSKQIHVTYNVLAKDVATIKSDSSLQLIEGRPTRQVSLRFRLSVPPFDKKEIRQAIAWAIDRAAIEKAVFFDAGLPANQFVAPGQLGHDEKLDVYKRQDLEKAKALLAAGGQPDGFRFRCLIQNNAEHVQMAQAVKGQLEKIGVTMEMETLEFTTWVQRQGAGQFDTLIGQYDSGNLDPYQGLARFFTPESALNVWNYRNPEYDKLLSKAADTANTSERIIIYKQLSAILAEDVPWVMLRYPPRLVLLAKEVQGYVDIADPHVHLYNCWLE
ncbi:MAG: ABC transporter substrate-binding protein [Chloroflexi bacterium]|nr:ABC transporter substrate-binding protein [Chloroflexota bacterium]